MDLMEKTGVIVTPCSSFGSHGEGYVRFALVLLLEKIKEALHAIVEADLKVKGTAMEYEDFMKLVKTSRTYRRFYEGSPVGKADLDRIVDCARFAPTGNNTQLLRFHEVVGKEDCVKVFSHLGWAALYKDWDGPKEGERPTAYILILVPSDGLTNRTRCYDVGIAAQTIRLAAQAQGLGGCIMQNFDKDLIKEVGLQDSGCAISLVLALGYAKENVQLEDVDEEHDWKYWRDENETHHVPKRALKDLLI